MFKNSSSTPSPVFALKNKKQKQKQKQKKIRQEGKKQSPPPTTTTTLFPHMENQTNKQQIVRLKHFVKIFLTYESNLTNKIITTFLVFGRYSSLTTSTSFFFLCRSEGTIHKTSPFWNKKVITFSDYICNHLNFLQNHSQFIIPPL